MDLLAHLEAFARIAEARSLTAAARSLRVSLPTLSRQLRVLEEELGAELLARTTRRLSLTPAGERLYARALRLRQEVDDARRSVREEQELSGLVVVSVPVSLGLTVLAPVVSRLGKSQPRLIVEVRLEDRVADFVAEGVDMALRASFTRLRDSSALVARRIAEWPTVLCASPGYIHRAPSLRTPRDLLQHRILAHTPSASLGTTWRLSRGGRPAEARFRAAARSNNLDLLKQLAVLEEGLALLPNWFVGPELARGTLVRVLPEYEGARVSLYLLSRRVAPPRVRAVADFMFADLSGWIGSRV